MIAIRLATLFWIDPPLARIGLNEEEARKTEFGYYYQEIARYGDATKSENIGENGWPF